MFTRVSSSLEPYSTVSFESWLPGEQSETPCNPRARILSILGGWGAQRNIQKLRYLVASLCMLAMATVWAFVIGQMCAVVSTLLPHDVSKLQTFGV